MVLSEDQFQTIETLGGLNYSAARVAMYLGLDKNEFLAEFETSESSEDYNPGNVRYHYDRGQLLAQAEIDKSNLQRAKDGNLTSVAQYKKDLNFRQFENAKKKILFNEELSRFHQLKTLVETGDVGNMPTKVVEYYDQIDYIRGLYARWQSKSFILNAVVLKWPKLSRQLAGRLYNETMNFFYCDNEIKVDSFRNMYAEKLDNLAALAAEMNDIDQARRCIVDAAELRGLNKVQPPSVPSELLERRIPIYVIDSEMLGIPGIDRRTLSKIIDDWDIPDAQKTRVKKEAMIQDIDFETLLEDETENTKR